MITFSFSNWKDEIRLRKHVRYSLYIVYCRILKDLMDVLFVFSQKMKSNKLINAKFTRNSTCCI